MRKLWLSFATSGLLAVSGAVSAATVLERSVLHQIQPDGGLRELIRLQVRVDSEVDLDVWSPYYIYLNDNRVLERVEASVTYPSGKKARVKRREQDTLAVTDSGEAHSSQKYREIPFPPSLPSGSVLSIEYSVLVAPYFPAAAVRLALKDPIVKLKVEVEGGQDKWRWRIDGSEDGLKVQETPGGVVVTAENLAGLDPPELAPASASSGPVLRYGWKEDDSWSAVGSWYEKLVGSLPRNDEAVRRAALEIVAGLEGTRARVRALLEFVRQRVRYEAVEVGIGGYLPSSPVEVLERRWGDCKDKAFLLIDLLDAVGIDAYPALIRASRTGSIDREFPSHNQFNHAIVALPASDLSLEEEDPVAADFLFLDATQKRGAIRWLQPGVQGQDALVVLDQGTTLVRTPVRPELERRTLVVNLGLQPDGTGSGGAGLAITGRWANAFVDKLGTAPTERLEEEVREIFRFLLPGVRLTAVGWANETTDVPTVSLSVGVILDSMVQGDEDRRSFRLPTFQATPSPRVLDERQVPVIVSPLTSEISWRITLPEGWCPAQEKPVEVDNPVGSFHQTVATSGRTVSVHRRTEVRQRQVEPELLSALQELSVAEHRAAKRRIRLRCDPGSSTAASWRKPPASASGSER